LEAFLASTLVVAIGEIGDKTQLLSLMLAARFRKPWPISLGILAATLLNHALAGLMGAWISAAIAPDVLRWCLGISFLLIAAWALKPDTLEQQSDNLGKYGVFAVTFIAFFIAEIGDKTQLATVALAARYTDLVAVIAGTTTGMLLADIPVVFLGEKAAARIPLKFVRYAAAALFAVMGIATLAGFSVLQVGGAR
jgi:putative Ca2+/H+ antiporter (TMEM165/GDT1 family)